MTCSLLLVSLQSFGPQGSENMAAARKGRYARDLFLLASEPQAAAAFWEFLSFLSPSDRSALQAVHWSVHSDLRWYRFRRDAVFDSESDENARVPARAG